MNYDYSYYLNLMLQPEMTISYEGHCLVLQKFSGRSLKEINQQKLLKLLQNFFIFLQSSKTSDVEKIEKIQLKLIESTCSDLFLQEKVIRLFDKVLKDIQKRPLTPTSSYFPILFKIAPPSTSLEEFISNLYLVLNHYPRFQFGENLAVYDTAYKKFPPKWNCHKVFKNVRSTFEYFFVTIDRDLQVSPNNELALKRTELNNLQDLFIEQAKPIKSIQMALVIENSPLERVNKANFYTVNEFVRNKKPVIANRYLLTAHKKDLEKLKADIYIQPNGPLCVILPSDETLKNWGFTPDDLKLYPLSEAKTSTIELHISNDLQKILMPSNEKVKFARLIAFCGHGTYHKDGKSGMIAGLSIVDFQKTLQVLNPAFLILDSCYAGGKNMQKVHLPDGTIPCPILVRSSFESVTFSSRKDRFLSQVISQVEKYLFRNITYPHVKQIQRNAIQQIIAALPKQKMHNASQLLLPASQKDIPKVSYGAFKEMTNASSPKELDQSLPLIYFFAEPVIEAPLAITDSSPVTFVSKGSTSHHFIKEIDAKNQEFEFLIEQTFNAFKSSKSQCEPASKAFFIAHMACKINGDLKNLNQIVIYCAPHKREVYFRVDKEVHFNCLKFAKNINNQWEKRCLEINLTLTNAILTSLQILAKTKPYEKYLSSVTAGRQSDDDFFEIWKAEFWEKKDALEVDLFYSIMQNKVVFIPGAKMNEFSEKKQVSTTTTLHLALNCFYNSPDYTKKMKMKILYRGVQFASFLKKTDLIQVIKDSVNTPFLKAVKNGDVKMIQRILKKSPRSINDLNFDGLNALTLISERLDIAELLIRKGIKMDVKNKLGESTLLYTITRSHVHLLSLMLKQGLDITGDEGAAALIYAMMGGNKKICSLLIAHRAGIDSSQPILNYAAQDTKTKSFEKIIEYPKMQMYIQESLNICVSNLDYSKTKLLLEKGANPNVTQKLQLYPLQYAVAKSDQQSLKIVSLLLKHHAWIDIQDEDLNTPLHWALVKKNVPLIIKLIRNGASLTKKNLYDITPFDLFLKEKDLLHMILEMENIDWNASTQSDFPLLLEVFYKSNLHLAKWLMKKGADIDYRYLDSPLIFHYLKNTPILDRKVILFFIQHANLFLLDSKGNTISNVASKYADAGICSLFYNLKK
ncbi:ankyrin repeat domain-containing protein [Parachlamydia acanthamoebae]|uniref:ankyrin repeat domain-containing protein n=1 Tax=Parachlamydia acanthamoebae TaxID=83552 RepID=UPI00075158FD|nr:ankyrin repeat domain-containing protein [Parachlamydia acanthamoebae]